MGDQNQLIYLKNFLPKVDGPILEVGSKEYGSTSTFRGFYEGNEYVGIDMAEGEGVDHVVDLTRSIAPLAENTFGLAICCSVLEHTDKPWVMAANLTRLVRPGGYLYMSVPWVWRYHPYPDDYFRFSHRGVRALFEEFTWEHGLYSTNIVGEFYNLPDENAGVDGGIDARLRVQLDNGKGAKRTYLPYLMVNLLGKRREAAG